MPSPKIMRALISVSDKTGLTAFARTLADAHIEIYSTGGTRRHLKEANIEVRDISDYTGFPEMMDGRLKTLHPLVHGGILCRHDHTDDMAAVAKHGIVPFELVVVNLYPFEQTILRPGITVNEALEQIDIGGPTMVRAAAKNHAFVTLATDASQYDAIAQQIRQHGSTTLELRRMLCAAAFVQTASYDAAIADYFAKLGWVNQSTVDAGGTKPGGTKPGEINPVGQPGEESAESAACSARFPDRTALPMVRQALLRYGENPHQSAAVYVREDAAPNSLVRAEQLHGKELSYNNLLDLNAALSAVRSLSQPGVVVLKHNNPCGAATADKLVDAAAKAWDGDPVSAFGSVLGVNVSVDRAMAELLAEPGKFVEAIVAPDFDPDALEILTTRPKWKKNVRLMKVGRITSGVGSIEWRQIDGGMLCGEADDLPDVSSDWQVVTETPVDATCQADLELAWAACRHVKSNAIVLARDRALVGVGAGQMSRVDSVQIAICKAEDCAAGSVLASDAFFPFDDSIHQAAAAGIVAVIQPGGSRRDDEVIAACNEHGLPMIFTNRRHFRH